MIAPGCASATVSPSRAKKVRFAQEFDAAVHSHREIKPTNILSVVASWYVR